MPSSEQIPARGPEQTFFADPALDRAVGMIMALGAEVFVLKDRLRSLEVILATGKVLAPDALDTYVPSREEAARNTGERDAFVRGLLEVVKGESSSLSAPDDLLSRPAV